jgi:hypothetical protein
MLSIKLIEPNGYENIREVTEVWTSPSDPTVKVLARPADGGETLQFGGPGTLYVMNSAGETIARYPLGETRPRPKGDVTASSGRRP